MNLEYFPIDSQVAEKTFCSVDQLSSFGIVECNEKLLCQAFTTDQESALQELFGDSAQNTRKADACLNLMATRIATVFASLKVSIL